MNKTKLVGWYVYGSKESFDHVDVRTEVLLNVHIITNIIIKTITFCSSWDLISGAYNLNQTN